MRLPERMSKERSAEAQDAMTTKTEFNGIGGPAKLHQDRADMCGTFRGWENGRVIGHARDRCLYRRCRRSDCACSGLFTLGAEGTQMTGPK